MTDYSNVHAVMIGNSWIRVSEGQQCEDEVAFAIAPYQKLICQKSAIQAVKVTQKQEISRPPINTPWEQN